MIIAVLLFLCQSAKSQRAANLDFKHGFNKFDLGSTLSSIKNRTSVNKIESNQPDFESYQVNYPSNYKLFGHPPKTIVLDFYNGLLTQITVGMPRYESLNASMLISSGIIDRLEKLYGNWEDLQPSGNMIALKSIVRKKTALFFQTFPDSAAKGDTFIYISIFLLNLSKIKS